MNFKLLIMILSFGFLLPVEDFGTKYGCDYESLDEFLNTVECLGYDVAQNDTHVFLYDNNMAQTLDNSKILDPSLFDPIENITNLKELHEFVSDEGDYKCEFVCFDEDPGKNEEIEEYREAFAAFLETTLEENLSDSDDDEEEGDEEELKSDSTELTKNAE